MATDLYFFSNVTLGYGSPKYISFIKVCAKSRLVNKTVTVEPMEAVRKSYYLDDLICSRVVVGDTFWGWRIFKRLKKSYRFNTYVINPVNALILACYILFVGLKSMIRPVAVVTTYDHPLFGLLSRKTILCQNFSEIWQEESDGVRVGVFGSFFQALIERYRRNVKFLIAPQEDRLEMAKAYYASAKPFLIHNAPSLFASFPKPERFCKKVVLYQGRVSQLSLADNLIEFAEKIPQNVDFHIAGIVNKEYRSRIEKLGEKKNVFFHGYLKWGDLAKLRSQCNIGILAWSNDTLNTKYCAPNKLYEYMASGMYVICFDNYSLDKLNQEFEFGYLEKSDVSRMVNYVDALSLDDIEIQGKKNRFSYETVLNFEFQHREFFDSFFRRIELVSVSG